jgi:hypothetical protein
MRAMPSVEGLIQSAGTYGTHGGHEPPRGDVTHCTCEAHAELLRRIDSIDGKLAMLIRQRHRSQKALLSLREAARRLGIDRSTTLADLIRNGRIKVVQKNSRPVIPAGEIERIERDGFSTAPAAKAPPRKRRRELGKPGDAIRGLTV